MNPVIHTSKTPEELSDSFALQLINWVNETVAETFHLALSGGKTPSMLFALLAKKYSREVPWQKIQFWWGDERMVAPGDPESNFGVVNKLLFSRITLSQNQIHRIIGEAAPEMEAKRYGLEIKSLVPILNGWPAFDLIMLGLGEDGHTASIFPDQMQLFDSDQITGVTHGHTTISQRITLTGKVLNNAKRVAFLVSGESKSKVFNEIIHKSENFLKYPAAHVHPAGELHWFTDEGSIEGKYTEN
jgi:6-phosphogluconolactonase